MDEAIFWVGGLFIFVLSLVGAATYTNVVDNEAMIVMVKAGHSPTEARCAIKGFTDSMCRGDKK